MRFYGVVNPPSFLKGCKESREHDNVQLPPFFNGGNESREHDNVQLPPFLKGGNDKRSLSWGDFVSSTTILKRSTAVLASFLFVLHTSSIAQAATTPAQGALYGAGAGAVASKIFDLNMLPSIGIGALLGYMLQQVFSSTTLPEYFADTGILIIDDRQGAHLVVRTDALFVRPNSLVIDSRMYPVMNKVVDLLQQYPEINIGIAGYTDATLPKPTQYEQSMAQAKAVADYLLSRGVDGRRITKVQGMADTRPILSNSTVEGRRANRRVEVSLLLSQPRMQPRVYAVDPAYSPVYGFPAEPLPRFLPSQPEASYTEPDARHPVPPLPRFLPRQPDDAQHTEPDVRRSEPDVRRSEPDAQETKADVHKRELLDTREIELLDTRQTDLLDNSETDLLDMQKLEPKLPPVAF